MLVPGGAGNVSHVLTPRLLDEGYDVTTYDQFGTSNYSAAYSQSPLREIPGDLGEG